jgi:hypothetical protein
MKRYVPGLNQANSSGGEGPTEGIYLARVERFSYRWHAQKPYYAALFSVIEPKPLAGSRFCARLYCTPKALWKLNWFLRDFGYDAELLARNELDDRNLVGLCGVVKVSRTVINGTSLFSLDGFDRGSRWEDPSVGGVAS